MAPAFTIGLNARIERLSMLMLLNGSPVGSTPTFSSTAAGPRSASASAYT